MIIRAQCQPCQNEIFELLVSAYGFSYVKFDFRASFYFTFFDQRPPYLAEIQFLNPPLKFQNGRYFQIWVKYIRHRIIILVAIS